MHIHQYSSKLQNPPPDNPETDLSLGSGFGALPRPDRCRRVAGLPEPKLKGGVPEVIASKSLRGVGHLA